MEYETLKILPNWIKRVLSYSWNLFCSIKCYPTKSHSLLKLPIRTNLSLIHSFSFLKKVMNYLWQNGKVKCIPGYFHPPKSLSKHHHRIFIHWGTKVLEYQPKSTISVLDIVSIPYHTSMAWYTPWYSGTVWYTPYTEIVFKPFFSFFISVCLNTYWYASVQVSTSLCTFWYTLI